MRVDRGVKSILEGRRRPLVLLAIAAASLSLIAFAGCGSSYSTSSTSTSSSSGSNASASQGSNSGSSAASSGKIDISNFEFVPKTVTVKAGTPITWTNQDSAAHTATAPGPNGGFDTGTLQKGDSKTVNVKAGTYQYVCGIHPFMKATLVVK